MQLTAAEKELVEKRWQEQSLALDRGLRTRPSGEAAVKPAKRPHPYFWAIP